MIGRPVFAVPVEALKKLKEYISANRSKTKIEIASEFDLHPEIVYQVAYRMGIKLARTKSKTTAEEQRIIDYATENNELTISQLARKLKLDHRWLRHFLSAKGVQVKKVAVTKRTKPVKEVSDLFQHDDMFFY